MNQLVVKSGQNFEELNPKLCKIAILNQVILEGFDDISCEKDIWNKNFKRTGKEFVNLIENLQKKIYNQHYSNNQDTFIYSEECTKRTLDLMLKASLEDYIDVMGFLEIKNDSRTFFKDFLIQHTNRINNVNKNKSPDIIFTKIVYKICNLFDVTFDEVKTKSKSKNLSTPRKLIAYFCHHRLKWTNEYIGEILDRKHANIYVMIQDVENSNGSLKNYKECLNKLI